MLEEACRRAHLAVEGAELVRLGENAIYRLPAKVIARITRPGRQSAARREVLIARWPAAHRVPAVEPLPGVPQPFNVDGRAVTWWRELPPHRHGTALEVAGALRRLHALTPPVDFALGRLAPFVRLPERIERATTLDARGRAWMRERLADLGERYAALPGGLPECVVHGDAWIGNVVGTSDGRVVLLDLERCAVGPPEWDLVSTAVKAFTLAGITRADYRAFAEAYGYDVTGWHACAVSTAPAHGRGPRSPEPKGSTA
ncbi:phosphotransferase family protein [Spongiactinospora rosea]|uniref:phosphotransferase family protein n=1 Tax=Spongiactinospora rosea TaxID=2248750 RepID=UPI0018F7637D|nr:aminoglycoside phosphotransferase family protein [Spongiactinospora rosea]